MIAVIDDDASARDAMTGLLESLGYHAMAFASAEDFLESGVLARTRCLISDVRMSGMSGLDLHAHLSETGDSAPTIFMTALATDAVCRQAVKQGAYGVLKKPFDEDALLECLHRALGRSRETDRDGNEWH